MTAWSARTRTFVLAAVVPFLVVFVVKLAVFVSLGAHPLLLPGAQSDDGLYLQLADRVAHGDVWLTNPAAFKGLAAPPFFVAPLYIYALAALLKIGGGLLAVVRVAQIIAGTVGVLLIAATARRWYGESAARWTIAAGALFGLATFYELLIVPAALEPLLTALDVFLLSRAIDRRDTRSWSLAGAAFGIHALNRPAGLVVTGAVAVLVLAWSARRARARGASPARALIAAVAFAAAACLVIAPATWRNWQVSHQLVPISSSTGFEALAGNGPDATGAYAPVGHVDPGPNAWSERLAASLLLRKTRLALSASFLPAGRSYPFFAWDLVGPLTFCVVGPWLLVPLGLVGLVAARPHRRDGYWLWVSDVPLTLASIVIFSVTSRGLLPLHVALLAPSGAAVAWLIARVRERAWPRAGRAALALAALAAIAVWPTGIDDGRAEEQIRMALYDIRTGREPEAEVWVARAVPRHPTPAAAQLRVGQLYESMNRPADALVHYRAGLAIDSADSALHLAVGRALFAAGQDAEAIPELERARSGPQGDTATRVLVLALSRLGRRDEANAAVRTLDPERWNADQAREFAVGLASIGRLDSSIAAWRRAAEAGGDPRDYERLGLTWVMVGRPADAIAPLEEAVRRASSSASIRLNYAVALSTVGRRDEARREAQKVLEIDPNYAKAQAFLRSLEK